MDKALQEEFISIIREELVPAMGCTEPIALAYAAARGREVLGCEPEKIIAKCRKYDQECEVRYHTQFRRADGH